MDQRIARLQTLLRLGYGIVPIVAGLDKFFNLLTDWEKYLSPVATSMLPFSPATLMHIAGVIEIAAGILVLTRWTRVAAYIVAAWLCAIALNLILSGHYFDVAVRDEVAKKFALTEDVLSILGFTLGSFRSGSGEVETEITRLKEGFTRRKNG